MQRRHKTMFHYGVLVFLIITVGNKHLPPIRTLYTRTLYSKAANLHNQHSIKGMLVRDMVQALPFLVTQPTPPRVPATHCFHSGKCPLWWR